MNEFIWIKPRKTHEDILESLKEKSMYEKFEIAIKNDLVWLAEIIGGENKELIRERYVIHVFGIPGFWYHVVDDCDDRRIGDCFNTDMTIYLNELLG